MKTFQFSIFFILGFFVIGRTRLVKIFNAIASLGLAVCTIIVPFFNRPDQLGYAITALCLSAAFAGLFIKSRVKFILFNFRSPHSWRSNRIVAISSRIYWNCDRDRIWRCGRFWYYQQSFLYLYCLRRNIERVENCFW